MREPRIRTEGKKLTPWTATEDWKYQLFKLPFHEACVFLGEGNKCDIYDTRPRVCRGFEAGSEKCQEARTLSGLGRLLPATTRLTIEGDEIH